MLSSSAAPPRRWCTEQRYPCRGCSATKRVLVSCSAVQLLGTTTLARRGRKHDGRRELRLRHRQRAEAAAVVGRCHASVPLEDLAKRRHVFIADGFGDL